MMRMGRKQPNKTKYSHPKHSACYFLDEALRYSIYYQWKHQTYCMVIYKESHTTFAAGGDFLGTFCLKNQNLNPFLI